VTDSRIAAYIYELGQLKLVARSGWWLAGIANPESVAEHSFRTAILGYVLSKMEGVNAERVALLCLLHDVPEARLTDHHYVALHYLPRNSGGSSRAAHDQVSALPETIASPLQDLFNEFELGHTQEAMVARDADSLECIFQAREYLVQGYALCQRWIDNLSSQLETTSARELCETCLAQDPYEWWDRLNRNM
jgi:putative hydrolase of HD superfamily